MSTTPLIPLTTPFQHIAIAASGGGFRAASFTLGTLSYLQQVKHVKTLDGRVTEGTLLDQVEFMGSASGGTITAAYFTLLQHQGIPFEQIYQRLYQHMKGDGLLKKALAILNDDAQWSRPGDHKRRNLINAFAKTYDALLFDQASWAVYWTPPASRPIEVCFNTTEFRRGLYFRFQTDGNQATWEQIGNRFTWLHHEQSAIYQQIKLGDILAASSCFPGGFEPILFPDDFAYADKTGKLSIEALSQATRLEHYDKTVTALTPGNRIGLMDGGITDNQGLASTLLADGRRRNPRSNRAPFDLILVTDVASYYMDTYQVPETGELKGLQRKTAKELWQQVCRVPRQALKGLWLSLLVLVASLAVAFLVDNAYASGTALFFAGVSLCATVVFAVLRRLPRKLGLTEYLRPDLDIASLLKKNIPTIKHFSDEITRELVSFLQETKLGLLRQMLMARVRSVLLMVADINLKHVRRLIYGDFYKDQRWENRRCSNFIYELSKQNSAARTQSLADDVDEGKLTTPEADMLQPSGLILDVAERARIVGTTLWYDANNEQELKDTVACGQFSTCVNLLQYVIRLENNTTLVLDAIAKEQVAAIRAQLEKDWAHFQQDPYWLWKAI